MKLFELLVATLATFRLAELITVDTITQRFRDWLGTRAGERYSLSWYLAELCNCPWCMGVWMALAITVLLRPKSLTTLVVMWFGIAGGQSVLQMQFGRHSTDHEDIQYVGVLEGNSYDSVDSTTVDSTTVAGTTVAGMSVRPL